MMQGGDVDIYRWTCVQIVNNETYEKEIIKSNEKYCTLRNASAHFEKTKVELYAPSLRWVCCLNADGAVISAIKFLHQNSCQIYH